MTWEQIVQQFIDTPPPGLTQGHLNELNAGNVDYATARNIVQQYSLPIAGEMTTAYKQLPANVQGVAFSSTASQPPQALPGQFDQALMFAAALEAIVGDKGDKGPPLGWKTTKREAVNAARIAYGGEFFDEVGDPLPVPYDIIGKNGLFTFIDKKDAAEVDERFSLIIDPKTGNTVAFNPKDPLGKKEIVFEAPDKAPEGSVKIGKAIDIGGGKFLQPYAVTDTLGNTVRTNVVIEGTPDVPEAGDIINFTPAEGGGRLIPLGGGRYTYEPPPNEPFKTSAKDVILLPTRVGA